MQYASIKDKNKVDIYVGDILKIEINNGKVEYFTCVYDIHRREMASGWIVDIPSFAFVNSEGFPTFPIVNNYNNGHDLDIIEIVGNIYED